MEDGKSKQQLRDAAIAAEAAGLAAQGGKGRDKAWALLLPNFGGRMLHYFMRNKVPEPIAEELVSDAIFNFVTKPIASSCPPEVWLWTIARNILVDWARARNAHKRGGQAEGGRVEVSVDDDAMLALLETTEGSTDLPAWVRDCVHKAAALMDQQDRPHAEVLWMVAQGWRAEDVAVFYGAVPGKVTEQDKGAARDRVYRAREAARGYFEHCRE